MDATEGLRRSWRRAWAGVGHGDADAALGERLLACYREPQRAYHTLQHLGECIDGFDAAIDLAAHPGEVELALWFHDAVYDVARHDNEEKSADWAHAAVLRAGAPADAAARIHGLVLATRHATAPAGGDAALLVDIDLAILGAPVDRFDEYERQVRREYAAVADDAFRAGRCEILRSFLARPALYVTERFRARLEAPARANLERSLERLGA